MVPRRVTLTAKKAINELISSSKILGIYFSYNQVISEQENYDRTFTKLQTMINVWESRSLTPYGKTTVLKSLALPKSLYVTSMVDVPSGFIEKLKTLMSRFLWSGHNPKYQTIKIKGVGFLGCLMSTGKPWIMFGKKLFENVMDAPWKHIPLSYLDSIGGHTEVRSKFNVKLYYQKICLHNTSNVLRIGLNCLF